MLGFAMVGASSGPPDSVSPATQGPSRPRQGEIKLAAKVSLLDALNMNRTVISPRQIERSQPRRVNAKDSLMFGSSLADVFRTPDYDCRAVGADQKPEFAVTRLRSGPREMEKAPTYPPDQAALICVSLTPAAIGQWQALYNGRSVGVTRAIPFATTFINLS